VRARPRDQRLDRRPVDDVERMERAAAIVTRIEGRRVDDQFAGRRANSF
jgi:hypothetical protein